MFDQVDPSATTATPIPASGDIDEAVGDRNVWRSLVVGAASFVCVLIASWIAGPDSNWDLLNYHYYNGRALLTGSFTSDVAAAGMQGYLHPLADAPLFVMIELTNSYRGLLLWTAIVQWLCYWSVWRLTDCFKSLSGSVTRRGAALAVAITGAGAFSLAFTTFGDWIVAALLCECVRRILRVTSDTQGPGGPEHTRWVNRQLVVAGVFLGLAMTVKLTSATFALAIGVGMLLALGVAATVRVTLGAVAAFVLVSGPWMLMLAIRYGNPVFPFYNGLFKSESAPPKNFDDLRYGSDSALDIVRFPVTMLRGSIEYTELPLQDWRFVGVLVLLAILVVVHRHDWLSGVLSTPRARFLVPLLVVSYLSWIVAFGIYRYFLFAELIVSVLIIAIVANYVTDSLRLGVLAVLLIPMSMSFQEFPEWGHGDPFFNPELDAAVERQVPPGAHVLLAGPPPLSYLTESFPTSTRFAGLFAYTSGELRLGGELRTKLDEFIANGLDDDSLFAIVDEGSTTLQAPWNDLTLSDCSSFVTKARSLALCQVSGA